MEDLNTIAADCIVISCCCQCLILQIVVFFFLKLPYRLIRKARQYIKKLRSHNKKEANAITRQLSGFSIDRVIRSHSGSFRIKFEGISSEECCGNCMDEIDKALQDMAANGEFAFGSFWRGDSLEESIPAFVVQNLEPHELQYNMITYKLSSSIEASSYFTHILISLVVFCIIINMTTSTTKVTTKNQRS